MPLFLSSRNVIKEVLLWVKLSSQCIRPEKRSASSSATVRSHRDATAGVCCLHKFYSRLPAVVSEEKSRVFFSLLYCSARRRRLQSPPPPCAGRQQPKVSACLALNLTVQSKALIIHRRFPSKELPFSIISTETSVETVRS